MARPPQNGNGNGIKRDPKGPPRGRDLPPIPGGGGDEWDLPPPMSGEGFDPETKPIGREIDIVGKKYLPRNIWIWILILIAAWWLWSKK